MQINSLEEAHALIQEAMKDVIQELIIVDGTNHHLVYIYKIEMVKGKLHVEYSTASEQENIKELVYEAIQTQIEQHHEEHTPWLKRYWKTFCTTARTLLKFGRT